MGDLRAFLNPESIAVVGAGERPGSSGGAVLRNLKVSGYRGRIVPVNPKGGEIQGLPAKTSLSALDQPVDLVTVLVKPESILDVVREAADTGHRNLLILPGGFAEAGEQGRERDALLRGFAAEKGLAIAGPNCAGVINLLDRKAPFAATFLRDLPKGGGVALVSQSGAIAEEAIAASHAMNVPLGAVISVGNGMQFGVADYVAHFGADKRCSAILVYLESFGDAARFGQVAREIAKAKPLIALIGGRTGPGREAAFQHTGSRPADDEAVEAFCQRAGIVRVKRLRSLMLAGKAFGAFPQGIGRRVLLLSNSGGPGVLAADRAAEEGLQLSELPAALAQCIARALARRGHGGESTRPAGGCTRGPLRVYPRVRARARKGPIRRNPDDSRGAVHGGRRSRGGGARRTGRQSAPAGHAFDDGHAGAQAGVVRADGGGGRADVRRCGGHVRGRRVAGAPPGTECGRLNEQRRRARSRNKIADGTGGGQSETVWLFPQLGGLPGTDRA
jgi:acyl-CoA synthetase (NDP forming)